MEMLLIPSSSLAAAKLTMQQSWKINLTCFRIPSKASAELCYVLAKFIRDAAYIDRTSDSHGHEEEFNLFID
jgi:hypothetical protein